MAHSLNEPERRVLGVLMEKELSQPEYYPMTLKAVVAGCNQKQNRKPVLDLDEVAVEAALAALQERGLLTMKLPSQGARSRRYAHQADTVFGWHKPERALMTELLLRGPQTPGELKTRCTRFVSFADLGTIIEALDGLSCRTPPMVAALPREPGQSATRYTHLLYPAEEQPRAESTRDQPAPDTTRPHPAMPAQPPGDDLHDQVTVLRRELDDLRRRVALLEQTHPGKAVN